MRLTAQCLCSTQAVFQNLNDEVLVKRLEILAVLRHLGRRTASMLTVAAVNVVGHADVEPAAVAAHQPVHGEKVQRRPAAPRLHDEAGARR